MNLIPNSLLKNIPDLYDTENSNDPMCYIKLFTPLSNWRWYIIELSKDDKETCFGYVEGLENELGYFSLKELESIYTTVGIEVERDINFIPTKLSKIKELIDAT